MKLTVYTLFRDEIHRDQINQVFTSRAQLDLELIQTMRNGIDQFEDPDTIQSEVISEIRRLIEGSAGQQASTDEVEEAWELFSDHIKMDDDYYYIDEHDLTIPEASEGFVS